MRPRGFALGCFQRERFYRQAERRWGELARTADLVVAVADFPELREPAGGAIEVPVDAAEAMAREWTLVIDSPGNAVCLAAWEHAGSAELPDMRRGSRSCGPLSRRWCARPRRSPVRSWGGSRRRWRRGSPRCSRPQGRPLGPELRFASSLAHRMVGYLGALLDPPRRVI